MRLVARDNHMIFYFSDLIFHFFPSALPRTAGRGEDEGAAVPARAVELPREDFEGSTADEQWE